MIPCNRGYSRDEHYVMGVVTPVFVQEAFDRKKRYLDMDDGFMSDEFEYPYSLAERFDETHFGNELTMLHCYYGHPDVLANATDKIDWVKEDGEIRFGYVIDRENLYVLIDPQFPLGANLGCAKLARGF